MKLTFYDFQDHGFTNLREWAKSVLRYHLDNHQAYCANPNCKTAAQILNNE